ncbi:MAG: class I SAM-dependent methyltransferase [Pseudomonadota bacterium]
MQDDGHFDAEVAARYDEDHGGTDPALVARCVDLLATLAQNGRALEFAIGTGRIALPLAARGVEVSGIELSKAMVAELRKKEQSPPLEVAIGDMTTTRLPGLFSLVYLVFNTIDNLTSQEVQITCFANASRHLEPGGRFVIETNVPPLQRLPFGETSRAFAVSNDHMGVEEIDVATQSHISHHVWPKTGLKRSIPFRYAWPAELDLMGRLAGLTLEYRWADWDQSPYDRLSKKHVSVWRKA